MDLFVDDYWGGWLRVLAPIRNVKPLFLVEVVLICFDDGVAIFRWGHDSLGG